MRCGGCRSFVSRPSPPCASEELPGCAVVTARLSVAKCTNTSQGTIVAFAAYTSAHSSRCQPSPDFAYQISNPPEARENAANWMMSSTSKSNFVFIGGSPQLGKRSQKSAPIALPAFQRSSGGSCLSAFM
jgi:hypothetical protein